MSFSIIIDWLQATLRWGAPLLIVGIGEVFAEKSGIINMGIEGIMLFGALFGIIGAFWDSWLPILLFPEEQTMLLRD